MIPKKKKNKAFAEAAVKEASGIEGNLNHESSHETIWPNCEPEAETQHWSPCAIEFCTVFWISILVVLLLCNGPLLVCSKDLVEVFVIENVTCKNT